jgi:hypothetical protein
MLQQEMSVRQQTSPEKVVEQQPESQGEPLQQPCEPVRQTAVLPLPQHLPVGQQPPVPQRAEPAGQAQTPPAQVIPAGHPHVAVEGVLPQIEPVGQHTAAVPVPTQVVPVGQQAPLHKDVVATQAPLQHVWLAEQQVWAPVPVLVQTLALAQQVGVPATEMQALSTGQHAAVAPAPQQLAPAVQQLLLHAVVPFVTQVPLHSV